MFQDDRSYKVLYLAESKHLLNIEYAIKYYSPCQSLAHPVVRPVIGWGDTEDRCVCQGWPNAKEHTQQQVMEPTPNRLAGGGKMVSRKSALRPNTPTRLSETLTWSIWFEVYNIKI